MGSFDFEGKPVPFEEGDTVASALFRAGVRTFSRSLKYHRRRGPYCMTGDCPNGLLAVIGAGIAGLAAARAAAADGSVLLCDEGLIGEKVAPGAALDRIRALEAEVGALENVIVLEHSTAIGIYDGPLVAIAREDELLRV